MMNRPEQVPTHSKQILNDTVNGRWCTNPE